MAEYDPLMYAPHVAAAPPPPQQQINEQAQEPLFIGPHNLVGPRLPPIDDIVANDPEIRRICSELAILSNNLIGNHKEDIMNLARGLGQSYHQAPFNQQQYWQPPLILEGWGNITENSLIQQIKFYVRMATNQDPNRRRSSNFQEAITELENSIRDVLTTKYNSAAEQDSRNRSNSIVFMPYARENVEGVAASVTLGAGSIGGIFKHIIDIISRIYGGRPPINDVRRYCDLILQLYRRIQAILVENGFQQGGKKRRKQTKSKRKRRQTKKRRRTYKK